MPRSKAIQNIIPVGSKTEKMCENVTSFIFDFTMPVNIRTGNGKRNINLLASEIKWLFKNPFLWIIYPKMMIKKIGAMVSITAIFLL